MRARVYHKAGSGQRRSSMMTNSQSSRCLLSEQKGICLKPKDLIGWDVAS